MPDRDRGLIGPSGRLIAGVIAIWAAMALMPLLAHYGPHGHQKPANERHGAQTQPPAPNSGISPRPVEPGSNRADAAQEQQPTPGSWPDWVIVAFTGALLLVAWLQHRLETRTASETKDALKIARDGALAAKQSADAAAALAKAGAEANEIARAVGETGIRPWVDVEVVSVSMSSSKDVFSLRADLRLTNLGKSPAVHIQCRARIVTSFGGDAKMGEIFPPEGSHPRVHSLLPRGVADQSLNPRVAAEDIAMVTMMSRGKIIAGPQFFPRLRVMVEYEWGSPTRHGKTVKNFAISSVWEHARPGERVANPIRLGEMPVTQLTAFEIDVAEVT